jgi:uncharacterized protein (TIRG00374 family)
MIKRLLLIVVGVALFLFILLHIDREKTWNIMKGADWKLCFLSLVALIFMIYLKAIRWSYLLKMQGFHYSVWNCFLVYMTSMYWGNITPGRAGDFIKVLYLKEDLKLSMGTGITSVLVDRVFDLYILLILGCLGILKFPMPADPRLIQLVWVFFAFLVLASILAFNRKIGEVLIKSIFQKVLGSRLKEKANQAFEDFHRGMEAFYSPALAFPTLLSVVSYVIAFWACSLLAQSIGLQISIFYMAFSISVVNIVSLLTFLGMGTREGALIILFGLISLTQEQALAFSLLLFLIGTVFFTLLCLLCFLLKPIRGKTLPE